MYGKNRTHGQLMGPRKAHLVFLAWSYFTSSISLNNNMQENTRGDLFTMNIIVCCKQIIDPEVDPSNYIIDTINNQVATPYNIPPVLNPFDENAVEAALQIKDKLNSQVRIISAGNKLARDVVKKPLAMGADEIYLLEDEAFCDGDSWSTAYLLTEAIKKIGKFDIIFCGRQAGDWDSGQVGLGIAELLGIPCVTLAKNIEIVNEKVQIKRIIDDGYQIVETSLPVLITVGSEIGEPRYATIKGIREANKKKQIVWKLADIGFDPSTIGRKTILKKIYKPIIDSKCEFVEGDNDKERGRQLADKLREVKIL